jgi:hypothetical protein
MRSSEGVTRKRPWQLCPAIGCLIGFLKEYRMALGARLLAAVKETTSLCSVPVEPCHRAHGVSPPSAG